MTSRFSDKEDFYDGSQLKSLFAYMNHGLSGDSVVAWIGGCDVTTDHMVDGEDLLAGDKIAGDRMLHFIVELFGCGLFAAVNVQRLFASLTLDLIRSQSKSPLAQQLVREGDDLFAPDRRKLSISIATVSPVSALIHFAVNVTNDGTPVSTLALQDLGLDVREFANELMARFVAEMESVKAATCKVRWVR